MMDPVSAHRLSELAAMYALGSLSQQEARAFEEHVAEGCDACIAELESFEQTVNQLAFSEPEAEPSGPVRAELLARMNSLEKPAANIQPGKFISILASEGEWKEVQPGVMLKQLFVDRANGIATSLVRMLAGTSLPPHEHAEAEQFFVIEGDCNVQGQRLGPGDYHRADIGSVHKTTFTVGGTLLLLVAPERYEVLNARLDWRRFKA